MKKSKRVKNSVHVKGFPKGDSLIFVQSANMLLHCMRKRSYLEQILKERAIRPRYNAENIQYLHAPRCPQIAFPMICFCDVLISRLKPHMKRYGGYGIALNKEIRTNYSIKPIIYVNPDKRDLNTSYLSEALQKIFERIAKNISKEEEFFQNYILSTLLYTKPIYENYGEKKVNLFDEREWRYVPIFSSNIGSPLLLAGNDVNDQTLKVNTDNLNENYWLPVHIHDIKYLFVPSQSEAEHLKKFILNLDDTSEEGKYQLLCKIVNFSDIKNDV